MSNIYLTSLAYFSPFIYELLAQKLSFPTAKIFDARNAKTTSVAYFAFALLELVQERSVKESKVIVTTLVLAGAYCLIKAKAKETFDALTKEERERDLVKEDPVLSKLTCPITLEAINDPVGDPNGKSVYERGAIQAWLKGNSTSPLTRKLLTVEKLQERPALRALIQHRINYITIQKETK